MRHALCRFGACVLVVLSCFLLVSSRASAQAAVGFYGPSVTDPTAVEYAFGSASSAPVWQSLGKDGFAYLPPGSGTKGAWTAADGVMAVRFGGDVYTVNPFMVNPAAEFTYVSVFMRPNLNFIDAAEGFLDGEYWSYSGFPNNGTVSAGSPFLPAPGTVTLLGLTLVMSLRRSYSARSARQ